MRRASVRCSQFVFGRRIAVQSATGSPPFVFFSTFFRSTPSLLLGAGRQASQYSINSQSLSTADYGLRFFQRIF